MNTNSASRLEGRNYLIAMVLIDAITAVAAPILTLSGSGTTSATRIFRCSVALH
jgi:hypothetical protein